MKSINRLPAPDRRHWLDVYGSFVAAPMHDVMVNISLAFNVVAIIAATHMLYVQRRWWLFGGGLVKDRYHGI